MVVAHPALVSDETAALLQPRNFPFFSRAIGQILASRYFDFLIVCSVIGCLHWLAEWLYLGRPSRRLSLGLLILLFSASLIGNAWLQPMLQRLHYDAHAAGATVEARANAARTFQLWNRVTITLNLAVIGGLVVYLWRATQRADEPRFITSVKFRG